MGFACDYFLRKYNGMDDISRCRPSYLNHPEGIPQFAEGKHHIAYAIYHIYEGNTSFYL